MVKAGRNEACPCGSGKKYKKCCEAKQQHARGLSRLMIGVLLVALAGGLYAFTVGFTEDASSTAAPGRVWSPEHGHYH